MVKTKKLILLDLDGTVLDENYRLNVENNVWINALREFVNEGNIVGISSDSPYETIVNLMHAWKIVGPIVSERGACVAIPMEGGLQSYARTITRPMSVLFARVRDDLVVYLKKKREYLVVVGDVNQKSRDYREDKIDSTGEHTFCVLFNGFRCASLSFFAFERSGDKWKPSLKLLELLVDDVKKSPLILGSELEGQLDVEINGDYSICIIHQDKTYKALALPDLKQKFAGYQFVAVGDSLGDFYGDDSEVIHCAVGNSSPAFKEKCRFVAEQSYTAGVIELLGKLNS